MPPIAPSQTASVGNWRPYYAAVYKRQPSFLAQVSLPFVDSKGSFLDVGAGTMNDSRFALEAGFNRVEALDGSNDAWSYAAMLEAQYGNRFSFTKNLFSEFDFGVSRFDWIHSNFALPYFGPKGFDEFMQRVLLGLKDSGVFSGTFFGLKDEWREMHRNFAFVTKEDLHRLLSGLSVIELKEVELDGSFYDGCRKFWHYFRVIAKRSDDSH
jgi:tellurite methyltransferase